MAPPRRPRRRPSSVYHRDSRRPYRRTQNTPNRQRHMREEHQRSWWKRLLCCIGVQDADDLSPGHQHRRHSPVSTPHFHESHNGGRPTHRWVGLAGDGRRALHRPCDTTPEGIRVVYVDPRMTGALPVISPRGRDVERRGADDHAHNIPFDPYRRDQLPAQRPREFVPRR